MQAFKDGLSETTERFASPLNFNPNMTCYFSMHAEDALFGANNLGHSTSDALAKIGVEHGPASKVMSKLHEHSVLTFHKILTSRRVLERDKTHKCRQNRPDPP